jgi:hypothetical protein
MPVLQFCDCGHPERKAEVPPPGQETQAKPAATTLPSVHAAGLWGQADWLTAVPTPPAHVTQLFGGKTAPPRVQDMPAGH